jgi:hypothetical protein
MSPILLTIHLDQRSDRRRTRENFLYAGVAAIVANPSERELVSLYVYAIMVELISTFFKLAIALRAARAHIHSCEVVKLNGV